MADVESVRIIVKDDDDAEAALTNFVASRIARSSALTDGTGALRRYNRLTHRFWCPGTTIDVTTCVSVQLASV